MGYSRFSLLLTVRLTIIMGALSITGLLVTTPGYHAATLLGALIIVGLAREIFTFISRTNQELSRFLDATRYADFGQRFDLGPAGAGFRELGETFTDILSRFRADRARQEGDLRHSRALIEHVPVPLISVFDDSGVTLWNNAARRLFGLTHVGRVTDLKQFGEEFYHRVTTIHAGDRALVTFRMDGLEQSLAVAATEITMDGNVERVISLQNIQSELDDTQLDAWQDLVRVLTHEILNTITPIASLARTASDLAELASQRSSGNDVLAEELADVKDAVSTVARRSDGLMTFVSSYRQLTGLPAPSKSKLGLRELFQDVAMLTTADWADRGLSIETRVEPSGLEVFADREMLEQVLINLTQNAEHALADSVGHVSLVARLDNRGRVTIQVSDNGPGIAEDLARKVFVPFYTTKRGGTGVGLALSRQIMVAHGGSIGVSRGEQGGACFTLAF